MSDEPQIYTCSYSEYHPDMGVSVRITLGHSRNMTVDATIRELAPHPSYFKADDDEFLYKYRQQLDRHGLDTIQEIFQRLHDFGSGHPLVLLCFERLNRNPSCHRRMFAEWWMEQTGQFIPELGAKPRGYEEPTEQLPLE